MSDQGKVDRLKMQSLSDWLSRLGYADEPAGLHLSGQRVRAGRPYALELETLLRPEGAIRAKAVFDVEGVPTVVFVGDGETPLEESQLDAIRQRIWNQNLATVVIEPVDDVARIVPARKLKNVEQRLKFNDAEPDGPFSVLDVASANLTRRFPAWFDVEARVDKTLLGNLSSVVKLLTKGGFRSNLSEETARRRAELLMGQVLFVSYLEHRQIIGATYRSRRDVSTLHELISGADRAGISKLVDALRQDFNGDFLGDDRHDPWAALVDHGFALLDQFLRHTDMNTGQGEFWNYDFSFIPVELLSGLYESFLSPEQQAREGAYYTPRHLAMMAVDQALTQIPDPLSATIFDGACGSGILLTTAYRRLISLHEAQAGRQLGFSERRVVLQRQIFGADINLMACRVTAFSLYLSLLEGLLPADIMEAQERENAKLPSLDGSTLHHGTRADFFSKEHALSGIRFDLLISNPPWSEPAGSDVTSADEWAARAKAPFVRRQMAGAYALRAIDFVKDNGHLCLILPIPLLLAPTSAPFVAYFFERVRPKRLINFGDLQNLLFPTAEHTCHLFVGNLRRGEARGVPFSEMFDYCVPKADMSLAFGRLTMQSADRHSLQTRSVVENPRLLVALMWGDANDLTIWTRLSSLGTFGDFWRKRAGRPARWVCRKGVHFEDASREPVSADRLRRLPFVPINALTAGVPVLHPALLAKWPKDKATVAGLGDDLFAVFKGPRVLFSDGFSREERTVRAVYFDKPATFNHSIGVIAGPEEDARLLQFVAVYLRSSLAQYFLMLRGWKMLCERNGMHLSDIEGFPFFRPKDAPNPDRAIAAVSAVYKRISDLAKVHELRQLDKYEELRDDLDDEVFNYFDLAAGDRALVRESVQVLMPSIRPRSYKSLDTPVQNHAKTQDFRRYARELAGALTLWRSRTGGAGRFTVRVVASDPRTPGGAGVVRVDYMSTVTAAPISDAEVDDSEALNAVMELRRLGLATVPSGEALQLVPDAHIWANKGLYLVRPLNKRSWTMRQARRDAEHIVRQVQARTDRNAEVA